MTQSDCQHDVRMCSGQRHRAQALAQGIPLPSQLPSAFASTEDDDALPAASSRTASEPLQPPPQAQKQPSTTPLATPLPSPCSQAVHQDVPSSAISSVKNSPESDGHTASEQDSAAGARSTYSRARSGDSTMPRRGLRFDVEDSEANATSNAGVSDVDSTQKQRPLSRLPSAGLPPIHRAASVKLQHQHSQQQQQLTADLKEEGQDGSDEEQVLPEGITAIQVADPDNPDALVLQVTCFCSSLNPDHQCPAWHNLIDKVDVVA